MADKKRKSDNVLGRDPFEGMDWTEKTDQSIGRDPFEGMGWEEVEMEEPSPSVSEEMDTEDLVEPSPPTLEVGPTQPMQPVPQLRGKGVWLLYSGDVDLAIKMGLAIGATHILYKTGHRGMFFVEAARRVHDRVREAGLIPFAWPFIHCDDPNAEAEVALKTLEVGYAGIVFDVEEQAAGRSVGAATLGRRLMEAEVDPTQLYYTSYPNIWQHLEIPYREMNTFCRGGFMPQCYPTFQRTPRTVIDKWAYGEHTRWAREWGNMPPLYPVLAAYKDEHATERLKAQEFMAWAEVLSAHAPSFFSIYRAGTTNRELWSVLATLGEELISAAPRPPVEEAAPPPPVEASPTPIREEPPSPPLEEMPPPPEPVEPAPPVERAAAPVSSSAAEYHIVTLDDTVWSICRQYNITREQFWEWNGYLWDEQGLPRDILYLQEGWRIRVG